MDNLIKKIYISLLIHKECDAQIKNSRDISIMGTKWGKYLLTKNTEKVYKFIGKYKHYETQENNRNS